MITNTLEAYTRGDKVALRPTRTCTSPRNRAKGRSASVEEKRKDPTIFLPACAGCGKIRDEQGHWKVPEPDITRRSDVELSHTICPDCGKALYGKIWDRVVSKAAEKGNI